MGWRKVLASLSPFTRETVDAAAAYDRYEGGLLHLVVRNERARQKVREQLKDADFHAFFEGFRNVEVRVGADGRTGREERAEGDVRRQEEARRKVEASPIVRRLLDRFGARIEQVEAAAAPPRDTLADPEEDPDEQPV